MEKTIKVVLAILLFACLLKMPYGFYQLVRLVAFAGFTYLAYDALVLKKQTEIIVFIVLALLFQPFYKIALGRELWNIVDIVVAVGLLFSLKKK